MDFYCWRWSDKQSYPVKKGVLLPRLFINTSAEESRWVGLPLQTTNVSAWKCPITKAARKHKSVWQLLSPRAPRLESARRCARCCLLSLQFTPCLQVTCSCPALQTLLPPKSSCHCPSLPQQLSKKDKELCTCLLPIQGTILKLACDAAWERERFKEIPNLSFPYKSGCSPSDFQRCWSKDGSIWNPKRQVAASQRLISGSQDGKAIWELKRDTIWDSPTISAASHGNSPPAPHRNDSCGQVRTKVGHINPVPC